jgi:hypothetical protein
MGPFNRLTARACPLLVALLATFHLTGLFCPARAQAPGALPSFDFRQPGAVAEWGEPHDIARIDATGQGMAIHLNGMDPYLFGPPRDFPRGVPLLLRVRLSPPEVGSLQVFFAGPGEDPSEEHSVSVLLSSKAWQSAILALPPLGPGFRLRLDPPGSRGVCLIESIRFEPRFEIDPPAWPRPSVPAPDANALTIQSGPLELRHQSGIVGGFTLTVGGQLVATGHNRPLIGYVSPSGRKGSLAPVIHWLGVAGHGRVTSSLDPATKVLTVEAQLRDPDGAGWRLRQVFRPGPPGTIAVSCECSVDAPRNVVFLPLLLVLPGHGSFGALKGQGLFAGVEYLQNEPSSSTADLNEPAARRRIPDSAKATFPLVAVQAHGRYLGLIWDPAPAVSALFDSPDRTFGTEGHVFGLLAPGANGENRDSGALFPRQPLAMAADQPVRASALLIGGQGESIVPAIQQYVALRGLPARPHTLDLEEYVHLAAAGWLDSPIRSGGRFRHALVGSFTNHPAADAAWMMSWLAALTRDKALADRLRSVADEAAASVLRPDLLLHAMVGHTHFPAVPLVIPGAATSAEPSDVNLLAATLDQARATSRAMTQRFQPDGAVRYRPAAGGIDYGRTHFSDEASGLTAGPVFQLLEAAALAGDRSMVEEGLRLLRIIHHRFGHGVPRGAQTWEIPLHTPDILASAYLVKAFALGYELTGEAELLQAAKYWAWTGVPFVYLVNPTNSSAPLAVGPFATIPVLGATNWTEPNWIGLPVQWCGLVYAQGLWDLDRHDARGPWRALAEGIAASGIAQTYPLDHAHHGLLPDSFELATQSRRAPDINPATLQPLALRLLAGGRSIPYEFRALRKTGLWIHAPGKIEAPEEQAHACRFTVNPWSKRPSFIVAHFLNKTRKQPSLMVNGQAIALESPAKIESPRKASERALAGTSGLYHGGTLILRLLDDKSVVIELRE